MFCETPNQTVAKLVDAVNRGDAATAVSLYEDDARLALQPEDIANGKPRIEQSLAAMISMKAKLTTLAAKVIEADGVALYQSSWQMSVADPSGNEVVQSGKSADILRFDSKRGWRILIDNPWGASIIESA